MSDALWVSIITVVGGGIFTLLGIILTKLLGIHKQINSRMDELVKTTKELGHSEGMAEGKEGNKKT